MQNNIERFFKDGPAQGQNAEIIYHNFKHQKVFAVSSVIPSEFGMFESGSPEDPTPRQNFKFPGFDKERYVITHLSVSHNFVFAVGADTGYEKQYQWSFEQNAKLQFEVGSKSYMEHPLDKLLGYERYMDGTSFVLREKWEDWYRLPNPVVVPSGGRVALNVKVPYTYTLHATGAHVPSPPTSVISSGNLGFVFEVQMNVATLRGTQ